MNPVTIVKIPFLKNQSLESFEYKAKADFKIDVSRSKHYNGYCLRRVGTELLLISRNGFATPLSPSTISSLISRKNKLEPLIYTREDVVDILDYTKLITALVKYLRVEAAIVEEHGGTIASGVLKEVPFSLYTYDESLVVVFNNEIAYYVPQNVITSQPVLDSVILMTLRSYVHAEESDISSILHSIVNSDTSEYALTIV